MQTNIKNEDLLTGIAAGDSKVIRHIYEKYFNSIAQYVLNNKGSMQDAQDAFQDAIMVIYEKAKQPEFVLRHGIHTYLFTISRNIWLKKLRKKSNDRVSLPENLELIDDYDFEEEISWRTKEKLYREKFEQLGESCQQILKLFLANASMESIATTLNLSSVGYAKKRKYQCKNQLLKLIRKDIRYKNLT